MTAPSPADRHPDERRPPGRPADAALGPAIIGAVRDILAEQGLAALTTAAVARRAGVSTATLYRRWPTKRELLLSTARQLSAAQEVDLDTGSLDGDLRALVDHKSRLLGGRSGTALLALLGQASRDADIGALLIGELHARTRLHLEHIRRRARERGEDVGALEPDAGARLLLGALLGGIAMSTCDVGQERGEGPGGGAARRAAASARVLRPVDAELCLRALGAAPPAPVDTISDKNGHRQSSFGSL